MLITHEHGDYFLGLDELVSFRRTAPAGEFRPIPVCMTAASAEVIGARSLPYRIPRCQEEWQETVDRIVRDRGLPHSPVVVARDGLRVRLQGAGRTPPSVSLTPGAGND